MLRITNRQYRRALLSLNGLAPSPAAESSGPPAARIHETVSRLGFVQIDPVSAVERAHHHILFTRRRSYRRDDLKHLLEKDRAVFENWTHDAAILPADVYPYWKHYFARAKTFEAHPGYRRHFAPVTPKLINNVLRRLEIEGPLRPRDFESAKVGRHDPYFAEPTLAKLTMEFLWRTGRLAVSHRRGQEKVYDLAHRVIPAQHFNAEVSRSQFVRWACRGALQRLGAATPAQIAHFYDALSTPDAARWCERNRGKQVTAVEVTLADGSVAGPLYALPSFSETIDQTRPAPRALRLLNPFDPLIHDRRRAKQVFGFEYALEIWVPAAKRRYGYYVLPILEGERFTGRIDLKTDRKRGELQVLGLWWEPKVEPTPNRRKQLEAALARLAQFTCPDSGS